MSTKMRSIFVEGVNSGSSSSPMSVSPELIVVVGSQFWIQIKLQIHI